MLQRALSSGDADRETINLIFNDQHPTMLAFSFQAFCPPKGRMACAAART